MGRLNNYMRILWIPFTPWSSSGWDGSRHFHLLRQLKGHDVHLFSWDRWRPKRLTRHVPANVHVHAAHILPRYWSLWNTGYPKRIDPWLNERLMGFQLRRLAATLKPDLLVLSSTHYATGFIPLPEGIPVLLDHVDEMPPWVAKMYFEKASATAAVSPALLAHASAQCERSVLIENGVDVDRYSADLRMEAKRQLDLEGKVVVSLIGLTCSNRLYFLDAFDEFAKSVPNSVLLLVGECRFRSEIDGHESDIRVLDHVPYDEVAVYFNATDIGLYPCDDTPYYREAHPLKIVEYSAAGCQVVTSPVDAFAQDWPNVYTSKPNAQAFAKAMHQVLREPQPAPDVSRLGWSMKARAFELLINATVGANAIEEFESGMDIGLGCGRKETN